MRKFQTNLIVLAAAVCPFLVASQDAAEPRGQGLIEFESDSFSLNRPLNVMTFKGFRIDTGDWSLRADEASASSTELDFEDGQWTFQGNVNITIDTALISAQRATFVFKDQRLISGVLEGDPAVFEDTDPEREGPVSGRAESVHYDNLAGTVELLGNVELTVGPYDTTGCDLVYYLREEDFTTGSAQCEQPFTMVISPNEDEEPDSGGNTTP
jgi:lipopolysaccharide transport protein LptA